MRPVAIVLLSVSLLVVPALAHAEGLEVYNLQFEGAGGLMLGGADYAGAILVGLEGTWTLDVDDSLWPDASDSTARFDHIWETFFADNYDDTPFQQHWRGYFDSSTLPSVPRLTFNTTTPGGDLVMNAPFVVQVRDYYADGILSQDEKHHTCQVSMTMSVETPLCNGYFEDFCGTGSSASGTFNFVNPPMEDEILFIGYAEVWYCGSPVDESTWGAIKAFYR